MTWPMIVLAVGSVFSGGLLAVGGTLKRWLEPVVRSEESAHALSPWVLTPITLSVVAIGIFVAYLFYGRRPVPATAPQDVSAWTVAARRDLYGDTINERGFMLPGMILTAALVQFDNKAVDGSVNKLANLVSRTSDRLRGLQTGFARSYAASMFGGAALVAAAILVVQLWR